MVLGQSLALKQKARILIPDCAVLIGVIDQYGILEEGEVFVQIRPDSFHTQTRAADKEIEKTVGSTLAKANARPDETIIEGEVLVTKNPCSHPGDIQKVMAVGKSDPRHLDLKHLYNVVVYSSKGSRPQQHKLSMGDLDGDTYFVTWDKDLVGNFKENHPPGQNAK